MTIEWSIILALVLLLVVQQIFWAKMCSGLLNKLMSRNYYEYAQAQALKYPSAQKLQVVDDEVDPEAERQAREINSLMGMV
jgi:hypothetical protein